MPDVSAFGIQDPGFQYCVGDKLLLAHTSFESGKPVHQYGAAQIAGIYGSRFSLHPLRAHELGTNFKIFVVPTAPPDPYRI